MVEAEGEAEVVRDMDGVGVRVSLALRVIV